MGNNLLSKIIITRVVKYFVKPPGQYKKLLPSWLLVKIVRILIHLAKIPKPIVKIGLFFMFEEFANIVNKQIALKKIKFS